MPRRDTLVMLIIIAFAAFLRLWRLDQYPTGLNADEAALGYNAYSLIETGRDEFGHSWPIHFVSFGDYKPALYGYLLLPFIRVLGLNVWAVRLPSALLGIAAVWFIYLTVRQLFMGPEGKKIGLLSAFFLSISPWHLHFSRGGWETNVATFFILAGMYFFLRGLEKSRLLFLSLLFFLLSLYTYHSARIIAPLLGGGLISIYRGKPFFKRNIKLLLILGFLAIIFLTPLVLSFFGPAGVSRFSGVGLFADTGPLWRVNELRGDHQMTTAFPVRVFHNKILAYGTNFLFNWAKHYHGEFLFLSGDIVERNRVPETGQMYLFDALFLAAGLYFLFSRRPRGWSVIIFWLAIGPLASAMTFQSPNAIRALNMVIPLVVVSAAGAYYLFSLIIRNFSFKWFLGIAFLAVLVIFWNVSRYLHQYYIHYHQTYPAAWEDGFASLVSFVKDHEGGYREIYITDAFDQPYILFLFYLQYPPAEFQREGKLSTRDKFGFSTVRSFDKYHFQPIVWEEMENVHQALIVGTEREVPKSATIIKTIYFRNGQPAFQIAQK